MASGSAISSHFVRIGRRRLCAGHLLRVNQTECRDDAARVRADQGDDRRPTTALTSRTGGVALGRAALLLVASSDTMQRFAEQ